MNPTGESVSSTLPVDYFDGRQARAQAVRLRRDGDMLCVEGAGIALRLQLADVEWPERTRHGARLALLADGASLQSADAAAWDAWVRAQGLRESPIVAAQQQWRWVAALVLALVAVLAASYRWAVPWAARVAVDALPASVDAALGEATLQSLDEDVLRPSRLPEAQRAALLAAFERAVARLPAAEVPPHRIVFRESRIGPNAFALPGGQIVMTDELVARVDGRSDTVTAVLGHELGHVRQRDGMHLLAQAAAVGVLSSLMLGDLSTLVAAGPVLLSQAGYSRDAERQADAASLRLMRAAGIDPEVMAQFFEQIAAAPRGAADTAADKPGGDRPAPRRNGRAGPDWLGIAIASHPPDEERMRYFRDAAASR